jgi:hypothetical protein
LETDQPVVRVQEEGAGSLMSAQTGGQTLSAITHHQAVQQGRCRGVLTLPPILALIVVLIAV